MKAIWNHTVIAESDDLVIIEGNYYFPPDSVNHAFLRASSTHTLCSWKGKASYYDIVVGEAVNPDAAWYYPDPEQKAMSIKNRIAFWRGVEVTE